MPELVDTVHELIVDLTGPAVVVANSFGCQIAIELALRHPEAVRRLVLTSPVVAPQSRSISAVVVRFAVAMRHEPVRFLGIMLVDTLRGWPRKGPANLRALLAYPIEDRAGRLAVPTVVVRGSRDALVPATFARRLAHVIPCGCYVEVAAAHALTYDAPQAITRLVLADGAPSQQHFGGSPPAA